jgi:putative alpha-1,2-mannosidase
MGSPLFPWVSIRLGESLRAPRFTAVAPGASFAQRYVTAAVLNDKPFTGSWLPASAVRAGGQLRLSMGLVPNPSFGAVPPPSSPSSVDGLGAFGCGGPVG